MNCRECLDLLDGLEPGSPLPDGCRNHAASCPACALALRVEETLRDAPSWAEMRRLSTESRARVLGSARMGRLFWRQTGPLFEDAAVTSLVILLVGAGLVLAAPSLAGSLLPEAARRTVAPYLQPLADFISNLFRSFVPLVHQPWGVALMSLAVFSVLMAAVLSVRLFGPALRTSS